MNLAGKSFKNLQNNKVVTVKDSFENIPILEDGQKMDTRALLNTSMYAEHIDPKSFFNNTGIFQQFAEKIKSIPLDNVRESFPADDNGMPSANDSAIIGYEDPEQEKLELMRKYQDLGFDNSAIQKQANLLSKIIDPEEIPVIRPFVPQAINEGETPSNMVNEAVQIQQPIQQQRVQDPIIQMFRNVKRTVDLNLTIEIKNKIPRADFIEMMEDSYETSIINFLAEEFTRQILDDPQSIKDNVISEIKKIVYKGKIKEEAETPTEKPVVKKRAPKKVEEIK